MTNTTKLIRQALRIAGNDWIYEGKRLLVKADEHLSAQEQNWLQSLRRDGFVVIKDYWPREKALQLNEQLKALLASYQACDTECPSGAYARFGYPGYDYGQGIQRLYHAEREVAELAEFRNAEMPLRIAGAYYGRPFYSRMMLFQHNPKGTVDGYYHIDGFHQEFKSFVYLDDVNLDNGPFTYLKGSHKLHLRRMKRQIQGRKNNGLTNFSKDDIQDLINLGLESPLTGPAGTLLLVDVRGIHFGAPQRERSRSVLVNYIMNKEGDLYLGK